MQEEKYLNGSKGSLIKLFGKCFRRLGLVNISFAFSGGMVASPWETQNRKSLTCLGKQAEEGTR